MPKATKILRRCLIALCILALASVLARITFLFVTTPHQIQVTDFDAYRIEALKANSEEAASFFQITVAVLGALWATMIVSRENRLTSKDKGDITMFGTATALLILCLWFDWQYGRLLAQLHWDMGPLLSTRSKFADVLNSRYVVVRYLAVEMCFYVGLILSAICTFSRCMLRSKT